MHRRQARRHHVRRPSRPVAALDCRQRHDDSANCLKAGEWQHVAATADAGTGVRRIYLNGKLVKEERGDSDAETLTRGYTLQRWMNACGGRGAFPIKFNGSIFVVDNKFDADYRAWGGGYWCQNTRPAYWPCSPSGDFDLMRPFFDCT